VLMIRQREMTKAQAQARTVLPFEFINWSSQSRTRRTLEVLRIPRVSPERRRVHERGPSLCRPLLMW
jgi:hypothetical protein